MQRRVLSNTMMKLRKGEDVMLMVLYKVCVALDVNIGEIMGFAFEEQKW